MRDLLKTSSSKEQLWCPTTHGYIKILLLANFDWICHKRTHLRIFVSELIKLSVLKFLLQKKQVVLCAFSSTEPHETILDWKPTQRKFPWNIVLLLGAGFALAKACEVCNCSTYYAFGVYACTLSYLFMPPKKVLILHSRNSHYEPYFVMTWNS